MRDAWTEASLGEVLTKLSNGVNCKQDKSGVGDRISRIESIANGTFDEGRVGFSSLTEAEKARFQLRRGDILFSHINSPPHVGKVAIFNSDAKIYHGINLLVMRPIPEVSCQFLHYFLVSLRDSGYWEKNCKKSVNQASVNQKDISKVPFSYPSSLDEQRRIVSILDQALEGIAVAAAVAERKREVLDTLRQSFLSKAFSGELKTRAAETFV